MAVYNLVMKPCVSPETRLEVVVVFFGRRDDSTKPGARERKPDYVYIDKLAKVGMLQKSSCKHGQLYVGVFLSQGPT